MKFFYVLITIHFLFCSSFEAFAQTRLQFIQMTDTRNQPATHFRRCNITTLSFHNNDGKYDLAVDEQLGVIGSDFMGSLKIGNAPAEGPLSVKDIWTPIDGYKRTFVGKHREIYCKDMMNGDASDDDWNITLETPMSNPLLVANREKLEGLPNRVYDINVINGEIDIKQVNKKHLMKYSNYAPKKYIDYIGMYGPWVSDPGSRGALGDFLLGEHGTYIEIHPVEQLWWTEKKGYSRIYHLNAANDNSGRFNKDSNFDKKHGDLKNLWQTNPMTHTFHVPFVLSLKGQKVSYSLAVTSKNNISGSYTDGLEHRLFYNAHQLLTIKEPPGDIVKIDFENVGMDKSAITSDQRDTIIKGFIKIETSLGNRDGDYAGNLFLTLTEQNPNLRIEKPRRFKVTLQKMVCTSVDDGDSEEEVMGFIGVRATSSTHYPVQANVLPDNSASALLWARLDDGTNPQKMRRNEPITINKSFVYTLPEVGSSLTVFANLDEDDKSHDSNVTMLDDGSTLGADGDDRLSPLDDSSKLGSDGDFTTDWKIPLNQLKRGQSQVKDFKFGSGGTVIKFSVKVEAL